LACGTKNLQQAFNIARTEIRISPRIAMEHRVEEAVKFCLLPENGFHDVPIFFRKDGGRRRRQKRRKKCYIPPIMFPPPPQILGRQVEQYGIIQALVSCRIVRVSGPSGVGKADLVKACCEYINRRLHLMNIHEIVWFTFRCK
jgi:hypothetical protein